MNNIPDVVKNLLIINVLIFLGTMGLPEHYRDMGAMYFYQSSDFKPFQIITSMFMHGNFTHLLFNMISLFFLGPYVEKALGAKRFLILYLLAGFGASALHIGVNAYEYYSAVGNVDPEVVNTLITEGREVKLANSLWNNPDVVSIFRILNIPVLGASGCVYGVMIAFATMFPNLKLMIFPLPIPIAAKYLGVGLVAFGLFSGFGGVMDGIAHFAHVGGAIVGFILVKYWKMSNLR